MDTILILTFSELGQGASIIGVYADSIKGRTKAEAAALRYQRDSFGTWKKLPKEPHSVAVWFADGDQITLRRHDVEGR